VDVTNSLPERFTGLMVEAAVYDLDGRRRWSWKMAVEAGADSVWRGLKVPEISGLSSTYFLRLQLTDANGVVRDINWYWLSAKGDVLNWSKSKWYVTPETGYADYSGLETLGKTELKMVAGAVEKRGDSTVHEVTITNTGKVVAFQVHLRALKGKGGDDILPVIFSDNYIELAPGESRSIICKYVNGDAGAEKAYFVLEGWNL
jgi:exo-1,4-beta-D-glucosaminidase